MSKQYKKAMDQLVLSDELKQKIVENAANHPISIEQHASKRQKSLFTRNRISYVACAAACVVVFFAGSHFMNTSPMMPATPQTPSTPTQVSPQIAEDDEQTNQATGSEKQTAVSPTTDSQTSTTYAPQTSSVDEAPSSNESSQPVNNIVEPPVEEVSEDDLVLAPIDSDIQDAPTLSAIHAQLGYDFKVPYYIPEGYHLNRTSLIDNSLVELAYTSMNNQLFYRTEKAEKDISGDYNTYEKTEVQTINNVDTTLKSKDEVYYTATWQDGDDAYAITSDNGLQQDDMLRMIESTNYPVMLDDNENEN